MVGIAVQRKKREGGQAVVLVTLAISIFLLGGVGLAVDGSQLYAQRQMAQRAADAAATAGITSVFNNSSALGTSAYYCTSGNSTSPCQYASNNGFTSTYTSGSCSTTATSDCIRVDPNPGVTVTNLAAGTPNEVQVTITRSVNMTLTKMLGLSAFNVTARATAAVVDILAPIPILVLDPTSQGAFSINGNSAGITITGGPARSIQVNSSNSTCSVSGNLGNCANTSGYVDLSGAGPSGNGGYFANVGGPTAGYPGTLTPSGNYMDGVSVFQDPLQSLSGPPSPLSGSTVISTARSDATPVALAPGNGDCPSNLSSLTSLSSCSVFSPGYYAAGINLNGVYAIFRPGIYYINHKGFQLASNTIARMATSSYNSYNTDPLPTSDPLYTGWTSGMLVYNNPGVDGTSVNTGQDTISIGSNSGKINNHNFVDPTNCPNGGNCFVGANGGILSSAVCSAGTAASSYYGIAFFESHSTAANLTHLISGGAGLTIVGTIYLKTSPSHNQSLQLQGNSGSTTTVQGEIITDDLSVGGTAGIAMNLSSIPCFHVREVALVNGE